MKHPANLDSLILQSLKKKLSDPFYFSFVSLYFSNILSLVIKIVLGGLVARYLGPKNLGVLSYASAIITISVPFMHLGIRKSLPVLIAKNTNLMQLTSTSFAIELIAGLLICIFLIPIGIYSSGPYILLLLYLYFLARFIDVISFTLQANLFNQTLGSFVSKTNLIGTSVLVLTTSIALFFKLDFIYFAALQIPSQLICFLVLYFSTKDRFQLFRFKNIKLNVAASLLKRGLPMMFSAIFMSIILKSDVIIIESILGPTQVGYYSPAVVAITSLYFLPQIASQIFTPRLTNNINSKSNTLSYYRFSWAIGTALLLLNISILPYFVNLVYGNQYQESLQIVRYLAPLGFMYTLQTAQVTYLNVNGFVDIVFKGNLLSAAMNVALNLALISIFGLKGVAIASAISIALGLTAVAIFDERSKHEIIKLWLLPFRYLSPKSV